MCQTIPMVVEASLLQCLAGSLVKHITRFLMESCVGTRTLGLSSSGKTFRVSVRLTRRNVFYFCWRVALWTFLDAWFFFSRIFDCTEFRYRYLSITVAPPECFVAERLYHFLRFPVALPQPSSQEIPEEPEAHSWV